MKGTIRPFQPVVLPKTPKTMPPKTSPAASDNLTTKPLKTPESEADDSNSAKTGLRVGGGISKPAADQEAGEHRSMSIGSSGSSDTQAIKEDDCDKTQELGKTSGEVKLTSGKPRDSTSSSSSVSFNRQSSSEEVKLESAPLKGSPREGTKETGPALTTKSETSDPLVTPLHSIKEEIMEFETSITPALGGSGHASPSHGASATNAQVETLLKENKINSRSSSMSSGGDVSTSHSLKEFTIGSSIAPSTTTATVGEVSALAPSSRTASPSRLPSSAPESKLTSKTAGKGAGKTTGKNAKDSSPLTTAIDTTAASVDLASHISNVSSPASSTSSSTVPRLKVQTSTTSTTEPVLIDTTEPGVGGVKAQNSPSLCSISSDYSDSNSPKKAHKSSSNSDLHIETKSAPSVPSPLSVPAQNAEAAKKSETDSSDPAKKKSSSRSVSTDEDRKKSDETGRKENESSVKAGLEDGGSSWSNQNVSLSNSLAKKPVTMATQSSQNENSKYSFHVISKSRLDNGHLNHSLVISLSLFFKVPTCRANSGYGSLRSRCGCVVTPTRSSRTR